MYQVGTSAGRAWGIREGEGESAIIKTPLYDNYLSQMAILNEQERRAKQAKEADDYQKRIDALNEKMAESDFSVDASTKQAMMQFLDRAAATRQRTGKNPFSAMNTDPQAMQDQKDYWKFFSLPTRAKAAMEHFKQQNLMYVQNPEKYKDDDNAKTIREGLGGEKLVEFVMSGKPLPNLRAVSPTADLAGELNKTLKAANIDPNDVNAYRNSSALLVRSMFTGPNAPGIIASARQLYEESGSQLRDEVDILAAERGVPIEEAMTMRMADDIVLKRLTPQSALMEAFEKAKDVGSYTSAEGETSPLWQRGANEVISYLKGRGGYVWNMVSDRFGGEAGIRKELKGYDWGNIGQKWKQTDQGGGLTQQQIRTGYNEWKSLVQSGNTTATGMLQGTTTAIQVEGYAPMQGKITSVKFLGRQNPPQTRTHVISSGATPEERYEIIVQVPNTQESGKFKNYRMEVSGPDLDRIAITPVTEYMKSRMGAQNVQSGESPRQDVNINDF